MSEKRWQLTPTHPFGVEIAADARLRSTDYLDDQVWEVVPGMADSPALALQTRYGGRVGLASIVPMWVLDHRPIYQYQAYAKPPVITDFAPGYARLEGNIVPGVTIRVEYWAIDSHSVGARCTLRNTGSSAVTNLELQLVGFAAASGKELKLTAIDLPEGGKALSLGAIGNVFPVIIADPAAVSADSPSKIAVRLNLRAGGTKTIRWVHAALPQQAQSIALAQAHLKANWNTALRKIVQAAEAIPVIETGDADTDAAIAFSYQQLVQSFLKPTASLPFASFVANRQPGRGYSPRGDGTDHPRGWSGQNPALAYLTALGIAPVAPEWAWGVLRNYLAVQREDGWIDWKPGLAGQQQGVLCMPILARLAWGVFQYTEDEAALRDVFPGLVKFLDRWFVPDLDGDRDGLPEWQSEIQTGYPFFPTFAQGLPWGQNADIRYIETPDLIAYLLSEAISLREIAYFLRDETIEARMNERVEALQAALESLWDEGDGRYVYRERDTHITTGSVPILREAHGEEEYLLAEPLDPPNRLVVHVRGGWEHIPGLTLTLDGLDGSGARVHETAAAGDFVWSTGHGTYTSKSIFAQIDRVRADGLSRVYEVEAATLDTSAFDLNGVLPLWSVGVPLDRAASLTRALSDQFLRATGVVMFSTRDPRFDPASAEGATGVRPFWLTLIGEGLIETGSIEFATDILKRLIATQVAVLKAEKAFYEFYHPDEPRGLGEKGSTFGIIPLHLLMRVLGIRIVSPTKVWTGGAYHWGETVTVRQHGITVRRSPERVEIVFPSGETVELPGDAEWQEISPAAQP